jgi:hypothetical protein
MPPGYVGLKDAEVTPLMQSWAHEIAFDSRTTYGDEFDRTFTLKDGTQGTITARVEHHAWTTDAGGNVVCGCRKGATLYHAAIRGPAFPPGPSPAGNSSSWNAVGYFSLALVLFSTVFGVASAVYANRRKR